MFEKNKSKKFLLPYFLLIIIFFVIIISNIIFSYGKKYKTIFKNDTYKISNINLFVKDIYLYNDNFYIEFINKNWLEDNNLQFKAKTKNNEKEEIDNILEFKFKGLYVIKIPVKNNFKAIMLTTILNQNEKFYIYFNESEIVKRKEEKTTKILKIEYINSMIEFNNNEINSLEKEKEIKEKEIETFNEKKQNIKSENEYSIGEEKEKINKNLDEIQSKINRLLNEILEIKNKIISLKNKNILNF